MHSIFSQCTLLNSNRLSQEEAVPESLKNVLLVMSSSGYLTPPTKDPSQKELWVETWKRIDRFLPDLRKELDLDDVSDQNPVEVNDEQQNQEKAEDSTPADASS